MLRVVTRESLTIIGRITATIREHPFPEHPGFIVERRRIHNLITTAGRNAARQALTDGGGDHIGLAYVAWGSDSTAPVVGDTTLGTELGRKAVSQQTLPSNGQIDSRMYLGPTDGVGDAIEEIGWFGGSAATASVDTGVLWSRILFSEAKTALISIQFDREDQFA